MTDTSTAAITALMDGVTPGPWDAVCAGQADDVNEVVSHHPKLSSVADADGANARFIAAARDLVPALLAERDALAADRITEGTNVRYFLSISDALSAAFVEKTDKAIAQAAEYVAWRLCVMHENHNNLTAFDRHAFLAEMRLLKVAEEVFVAHCTAAVLTGRADEFQARVAAQNAASGGAA